MRASRQNFRRAGRLLIMQYPINDLGHFADHSWHLDIEKLPNKR
jgi:hypothetical protein